MCCLAKGLLLVGHQTTIENGEGFYSLRWHRLIGIRISVINLRQSSGCLMFIIGISIPIRRRLFVNGHPVLHVILVYNDLRRIGSSLFAADEEAEKCIIYKFSSWYLTTLQWRPNERDGVSNHQPHGCLKSTVYSGADQRKHQSSAHCPFVCGEFTGERWIPRTKGQ